MQAQDDAVDLGRAPALAQPGSGVAAMPKVSLASSSGTANVALRWSTSGGSRKRQCPAPRAAKRRISVSECERQVICGSVIR
jgi:hypothetical protein